jgi:hypothetical protein
LTFHYHNHDLFPPKTKKGHDVFAAMAFKNRKAMGGSFLIHPWLFLVYITLTKPPQRQADQCKIGIKPVTINIAVCI